MWGLRVPLISAVRGYFARREDPYAGGDIGNAQRIGSLLFGLQALLMAALWPLSPPNHGIGDAGWGIAVVLVALGFAVAYRMWRRAFPAWTVLLWLAYGAATALGVMQWLGGGLDAPYEEVCFLPVFFVAAIQPPRRIAGFVLFVAVVLLAPLLYEGWDAEVAGELGATAVMVVGLSLGVNLPMTAIRAQRLAHAQGEAAARQEARIDALTGLRNRRAFDEALNEEVKRADRLDIPLAVAMVDIVEFKRINDRWGYAEGDRCLREVADALRSNLREPDDCFRWGGDEFALILTGTAAGETESLAERLRVEVADSCRRPDDQRIEIRFAVADLREATSPAQLTEMAGLALTAGKLAAR
jgi:diguanylate cyclase (GGDEF)-like protein